MSVPAPPYRRRCENTTKIQNFISNEQYSKKNQFFLDRDSIFYGWRSTGINQKNRDPGSFPPNLCSFLTLISYSSTELHGFLLPPCMPARVSCRASWVSCFLLHPYYYLLCLLVKIDVQISELYGGIVLGER